MWFNTLVESQGGQIVDENGVVKVDDTSTHGRPRS